MQKQVCTSIWKSTSLVFGGIVLMLCYGDVTLSSGYQAGIYMISDK